MNREHGGFYRADPLSAKLQKPPSSELGFTVGNCKQYEDMAPAAMQYKYKYILYLISSAPLVCCGSSETCLFILIYSLHGQFDGSRMYNY